MKLKLNTSIKTLLLSLLLLFEIYSCNKFEEGDNFTIHSKKNRLENRWKIEQQLYADTTIVTGNFINYYEFFKNGKYEFEYDDNGAEVITGSWDFYDNKKSIILHTPAYQYRQSVFFEYYDTLRIKKLTKDELWLEKEISRNMLETRYVPY